ncbi:MAG: hypothetical protein IJR47_04755 [Clostridia bacterium]|nr:hypothetical protein [Clostridia bacterium]
MEKFKKYLCVLCAFALVAAFAGCKNNSEDYSNQTIRGRIAEINGNSVTIEIGNAPPSNGQQQRGMRNRNNESQSSDETQNDSGEQPSAPSQDSSSSDNQNGNNSSQPPAPPQGFDSQDGQNGNGQPSQGENGQGGGLRGQGETKTFDLSNISITKNDEQISISDIATGDMIEITFGGNNSIQSVKVMNRGGSQQKINGDTQTS